ncbi:MAG: thioredoxin family protein [Gracilibacteraceae bacterium]|jgi:thioredoxin 1|nr:thioredoxin family protein [Gracilibacteraceae bacterium]
MAITKLDTASFERCVSDGQGKCLVVFSRPNCHVCAEVVPMLEELAPEYAAECAFYYVDVEEQASLFKTFPLKGVPSLMFFQNGDYEGKLAGLVTEEQVREKIASIA